MLGVFSLVLCCVFTACQTVHDGTEKAGTYIGKGVDAVGGVTEGAVEGYMGGTAPTDEENPYNR